MGVEPPGDSIVLATHNHLELAKQGCRIYVHIGGQIKVALERAQTMERQKFDVSDLEWSIVATKSPKAQFSLELRFHPASPGWVGLEFSLDSGRSKQYFQQFCPCRIAN
jgi:hypothetical protein